MNTKEQHGQSMILAAVMVGVLAMFILYLLINVGGFYRDTRQIAQIATRAARDGTTALAWRYDGLNMTSVSGSYLPPTDDSRQCLDTTLAKSTTREALRRDLGIVEQRFDGVSVTDIADDVSGTYLTLASGNPAGLGCASMGDVHPQGESFSHPWVYIHVTIPVKSLFGNTTVLWQTEMTVTNATDTYGG